MEPASWVAACMRMLYVSCVKRRACMCWGRKARECVLACVCVGVFDRMHVHQCIHTLASV